MIITGWNPERVETLKTMYASGHSFTEIAGTIHMSRGACAGKLFRLGLTVKRKPALPGEKRGRTPKRGEHLAELRFAKRNRAKWEASSSASRAKREIKAQELRAQFEAVEIVDLPPDQSAVAIPFSKLNSHTCRWPLGDARDLDAIRFCGSQPNPDHPYCDRHCRMAYQPMQRAPARPWREYAA